MSEGKSVIVECRGPIMRVTLNRPELLNAINPESQFLLAEAFDRFAEEKTLQVATITGSGDRAFCVGTDLKERIKEGSDEFPDTGFAGLTERFDLNKPVVALVNGDAIGGGLEIVLACDLAITVDHARFGLPEPRVGLAAKGGLHRLGRQIPMKHAMEIALTGKLFDAKTALDYGLVNHVVEQRNFGKVSSEMLKSLIECAPLALKATKQMIQKGQDALSLEEAYQKNYPEYDLMLASKDALEGNRAFIEKRKPVWQGK